MKNFPKFPKNFVFVVNSPPKLPAHFETPGKFVPDTSLKDTAEPVSSKGKGALVNLTYLPSE